MAKTNPIGVRFDETLLNKLKEASIVDSPQKALNLYEKSYLELIEMKVAENNKPENKAKIEADRNGDWIPPHPKKEDFKESWDYSVAKADWKKKYNLT